jgi:HK97 family phage prohead protease
MTTKRRTSGLAYGLKTLTGEGAGVFEAIVSVFGNVDYAGDRVLFGAFANSLEAWKSSGDPIPVIFSHQWDDLDSHVGVVLEAEELAPGDARLPEELKANGGLWVKFRLDVEEDFAGRLAKKLERRSLREFSFAYDVKVERRAGDGANDLVELDLIEVGPCLKGMNPSTALMSKALEDLPDEDRAELGMKVFEDLRAMGELEQATALAKTFSHAFLPLDDDPSRCVLCGLTRSTLGHLNMVSREPGDSKSAAPITYAGSAEERQAAILEAAYEWASAGDVGNGGFYGVHLDATFDERAVIVVEGWNDPVGTGIPYEVAYSIEDGAAVLEEPVEVVVEATTRSKGRRSAWKSESGAMVSDQPKTDKAKAKSGTLEEPEVEDQVEGDDPGADPALVELAIADLELGSEGAAPSPI